MFLQSYKLVLVITVLLFINSMSSKAQSSKNTKPNIIFILTDDLGYGDIGVFFQNQRKQSGDLSQPYEISPNIDEMAKNGLQFTSQYANAPVCAPSRASFLTGIHQGNANVRNNQFDKALEDNHNVATILKQAGYSTAVIGKWGLQGEKEEAPYWPAHPLKRGFDYFYGYIRHADGHEHYPKEGIYRGKKEVWDNYKNVTEDLDKCYTTDLWTAKAKQWIIQNSKNNDQPFFMYLAYDAPHAVLELPTQAYPSGGGLKGGIQWLNQSGKMISTASGTVDSYIYDEYKNATYLKDNNTVPWPETYKRYATATRRIDDGVGDLLQLLKDLKIDENTLVIFTSDNGASIESYLPANYVQNLPTFFGSTGPFDGIKRDCWEGGLRVPTVAMWKGKIKPGTVVHAPSMLSDWATTFAAVAQTPAPARLDGVSLLPTLTNNIQKQQESNIYVEYFEGGNTPDFKEFDVSHRNRKRNQMQMLRLGNYVGVRYNIQSADDAFEIYDVVKDPKQTRNLASLNLPAFKTLGDVFKNKALQMRKSDAAAKRPYDDALIPAVTSGPQLFNKGINWKFYSGSYTYTSFLDSQNPQSKGRIAAFNLPNKVKKDGMLIYDGYIQILEDGRYDFSFQINGKAFVRLHNAILFDADFGYKPHLPLTQTRYLKKGFHPIKISILHHADTKMDIQFMWKYKNSDSFEPLQNILYTHKMDKKAAVFLKK